MSGPEEEAAEEEPAEEEEAGVLAHQREGPGDLGAHGGGPVGHLMPGQQIASEAHSQS